MQTALALESTAGPHAVRLTPLSQHSSSCATRSRHGPSPNKRVCRREDGVQSPVVCMGLKAKETFDASFTLDSSAEDRLHNLLNSDAFSQQVVQQCRLSSEQKCKFTGILFQPVPWSVTTKKGMPQEFEHYLASTNHLIINVPPNFMFQAKIFKPSRLCAIFEKQ